MKTFMAWLTEETIYVQWNDSGMDVVAAINGTPAEIKKVAREVAHTKHMKLITTGAKNMLKIPAKNWLSSEH